MLSAVGTSLQPALLIDVLFFNGFFDGSICKMVCAPPDTIDTCWCKLLMTNELIAIWFNKTRLSLFRSVLSLQLKADEAIRFLRRAEELATDVLGPKHHYIAAITGQVWTSCIIVCVIIIKNRKERYPQKMKGQLNITPSFGIWTSESQLGNNHVSRFFRI